MRLVLVSAALTFLLSYEHFRHRGWPYVVKRLLVTSTVKDSEGRTAHLTQEENLLIQTDNLSVFTQPDVGAPGEEVSGLRVGYEGANLLSQQVQGVQKGLYNVITVISPPARAGDNIKRTLDFDVSAEPSKEDGHLLPIEIPTQYAEVRLLMPAGRICKASALLINGVKAEGGEEQPKIMDGGLLVVWKKPNPQSGKEYGIMCYH